MKKSSVFKKSIIALLPITLGLGVALSVAKNPAKEVSGYSTSTLPTTIDLNDTSASNIRSYYSTLNNLSTSERQGTNLLKNLKTILKNEQKYYSYDNGSAIWQMYEITDRDWDKSPASDISGYNSSTKIISNYTYGTSTSSKGTNPYIHALYINRNVDNQVRAWDDHQQTQWGINREHVWAKAEGFDSGGSGGARGDAMHLMAGNGYANNIHSNNFYGYVDTSSSYTNCGTKYSNLNENLSGKSKTLGGSTSVFEPQDCDKGDIARAIFYMVARYNYYSGSDSDGIDGANPNLALSQSLSDWSSSGFTSSTTTKGYMGIMTDLLAWHHADPVDEFEIHRNNLLYTNFTNNRNPFIDFPEWADFIWGSVNYSGSTYISHSTTPTGYATPSSDTINGYNSGGGSDPVSVTGVTLNTNSASIEVDEEVSLTATVQPINATNQGVTWSTSNSSIATVSNGTVTGVAEGSAVVTVTTTDGGFTASCTVTVTQPTSATDSTQFSLINSTQDLEAGKSYIITSGTSGSVVALGTTSNSNNRRGVEASVVSDKITRGSSIMSLTLGGESGAWTFATQNYSGTNGYLTPGESTSQARLFVNSSNDAYGLFTISFNNDAAVITSTGKSAYNLIRYNSNGGTNPLFSCYTSGQADIYLWKEVSSSVPLTSISASVSKNYKVGERISSSDISVIGNNGQSITSFTFSNNNYQFTYSDASSGGALTLKTFTDSISYNELSCSLTIQVSREEYVAPEDVEVSLVSSSVFSEIGGSNKSLVSGSITYESITYEYYKAYYYDGGSALSFGNASNQAGYLKNTTPFDGGITNVTVTSTGRTINIRYSADGSTWVLKNSADVTNNIYRYFKVDCAGNTGSTYSNITQISIVANGSETALNLSNYIMFADTNGQCNDKFETAEKCFYKMSSEERSTLMVSDNYVITNARNRLIAWATHFGKTIVESDGDYVIQNSKNFSLLNTNVQNSSDTIVIIVVCGVTLTSMLGLLIIKKRRRIYGRN